MFQKNCFYASRAFLRCGMADDEWRGDNRGPGKKSGFAGILGREAEGGWDMPKKIWHTYQVCGGGGKKMVKTDWVRRDEKDAKRKEGSQSVRRAFFLFKKIKPEFLRGRRGGVQ